MKLFALSDIHGCIDALENALAKVDLSGENKLILLGDYIHYGADDLVVLDRIMALQEQYGSDKVIALKGNHEVMATADGDERWGLCETRSGVRTHRVENEEKYMVWMSSLPLFFQQGKTVFCHAGVDEDAGDLWEWSTDEAMFTGKYPPQLGAFDLDIVAGHTPTSKISANPNYHDIYYDGFSHYYIDGGTPESGVIPVLMLDTETGTYYQITDSGVWLILPYDEEN